MNELARSNDTEIYRLLTIEVEDEDDNAPRFDQDIVIVLFKNCKNMHLMRFKTEPTLVRNMKI